MEEAGDNDIDALSSSNLTLRSEPPHPVSLLADVAHGSFQAGEASIFGPHPSLELALRKRQLLG